MELDTSKTPEPIQQNIKSAPATFVKKLHSRIKNLNRRDLASALGVVFITVGLITGIIMIKYP